MELRQDVADIGEAFGGCGDAGFFEVELGGAPAKGLVEAEVEGFHGVRKTRLSPRVPSPRGAAEIGDFTRHEQADGQASAGGWGSPPHGLGFHTTRVAS